MKNKKTLFWLLGILIIFTIITFSFSTTYAASGNGVDLSEVKESSGLSDQKIADILKSLLNWLLEIVGVIALIGFVISGIMYLISAGNEEMITKAKKYMLYCLVGVVVVLASFVIVKAIDTILKAGGDSSSSSYGSNMDDYGESYVNPSTPVYSEDD